MFVYKGKKIKIIFSDVYKIQEFYMGAEIIKSLNY